MTATATTTKPAQSVQQVGPGIRDPKPAKATPAPTLDQQVAKLRAEYLAADAGETKAKDLFDAAQIAWENSRVIKVRVAYAAAMLTPNKGEANLLAATRYLLTDPADTPAKRTAQAKSRKNTLRNYVAAGVELQAKGLASRITEPDEEERKIVAAVFREMNKRDKQEAKGEVSESESEGVGGSTPDAEDDADALTFTALLAHVSRMNGTADMLIASGVPVTGEDLTLLAKVLDEMQIKLAVYAG